MPNQIRIAIRKMMRLQLIFPIGGSRHIFKEQTMNKLFKALAALVAAFSMISAPAFAGTIVGCKMEGGIAKKVVSFTADEMQRAFLDNRGARTMVSGIFYKGNTLNHFTNCEDALVSVGLKKATQEKKEVKVLGGRPIVPNPQKTLGTVQYCESGKRFTFDVTFGKISIFDSDEPCKLDPSKTVTLAGH